MRAIFWNIHGFGHAGRRTQLKEYMHREDVDIVGLQETIKGDFRFHELLAIATFERFEWKHDALSLRVSNDVARKFDSVCMDR